MLVKSLFEGYRNLVCLSKGMQGAAGDQDGLTWLFVAFGLNTGMRHSEILRVKWTDIDLEQRRIFITRAKAGQREQPITKVLSNLLRKERDHRQNQEGYVFEVTRKDGLRGHRMSMSRQFERAVILAKLDPRKVTPHVMRHTAITQLVKAGVDLPTIQRISGHKTLAMVMRYVHLSGEHIDNAITAIETDFPDTITPKLHMDTAVAIRGAARHTHKYSKLKDKVLEARAGIEPACADLQSAT